MLSAKWRRLVILVTPDGGAERLADAEADADTDANNEQDNHNLGDDLVAGAQLGHDAAAALHLGSLVATLPVILAGPDGALALGLEVGGRLGDAVLHGVGGGDGLNVCVERVGALDGARQRVIAGAGERVDGAAEDVDESSLLGDGDGGVQGHACSRLGVRVRHLGEESKTKVLKVSKIRWRQSRRICVSSSRNK